MLNYNVCSDEAWNVLSVSNSGEAVMAKQTDGSLIIAKARAFSAFVGIDVLYNAYLKRLQDEVVINCTKQSTVCIDDSSWILHLFFTDRDVVQYVLYATAQCGDLNCVLEVLFSSPAEYLEFMQGFVDFVRSIDFTELYKESADLSFNEVSIHVHAVSDVVCKTRNDNVLVFLGKNKYFTVSIGDSQSDFAKNEGVCRMEVKGVTYVENGKISRWVLYNEKDVVTGVLELEELSICGKTLEILGYWMNDTDNTIADNLEIEMEVKACKEAKEEIAEVMTSAIMNQETTGIKNHLTADTQKLEVTSIGMVTSMQGIAIQEKDAILT